MPARSKAQQRLMQAAEHGATFPMARKIRSSMTHAQMHDFAVGSEAGKPEHVASSRKKPRKGAPVRDTKNAYAGEANAYSFRTPRRGSGKKPGAAY